MFNNRSGGLLGIGDYNGPPLRPSGLLGVPLPPLPVGDSSSYPSPPNGGATSPIDISRLLALTFPPLPAGSLLPYRSDNDYLQEVRNPIKCSGPNSACELPRKERANGVFRDPEVPPFRLCPKCFEKLMNRPGMGDDTRRDPQDDDAPDMPVSAVGRYR